MHQQPHTDRITPSQRTTTQPQLTHDTKLCTLQDAARLPPQALSSFGGTRIDLIVASDEEDRDGDSEAEDEAEDGGPDLPDD